MKTLQIAYLGPEGSFSFICASAIAGRLSAQLKPCKNIAAILQALDEGQAGYALLPIENSLGGSVPESIDGLIKSQPQNRIQLEWVWPVEHCLLGFGELAEVNEVRAHFQALAQCEAFLQANLPQAQKKEMSSNSASVQSLLSLPETERRLVAAIGPEEAGHLYHVPVIKRQINDSNDNFTRFWLIGREPLTEFENSQKLTSLAFRIPQDAPGGLMRVLACLADRKINLSKIESRPTKGRLCEYIFLIDFVNPPDWTEIQAEVTSEISNYCSYLRFLGTYTVWPECDQRFAKA